ncbi:MAG: heavy metal-associated domain-containing protein [Flavobacteriales bacterium]|jgi:cation transport ATPase|nr:heavy metal-associated domain-containing protein [Flavobacteriales bacterium]
MRTILTISMAIGLFNLSAQDKGKGPKEAHLDIRTTSVCDMCEVTIEGEMIYEKGVKKVDLDLATGALHITYDPRKNTPDGLRTALTKLGYWADDMPADPVAFAKLPDCCQKEGCGKPKEAE